MKCPNYETVRSSCHLFIKTLVATKIKQLKLKKHVQLYLEMNKNSWKGFRRWFHQFRAAAIFVYCIELTKSSDCSIHGKIIARFELWTEHSEYLKKWSALFFPDLSGKSNNRKFRNVVMRNGNTEKAQNYEMFVQLPYAWSYECHPRKL